MLCAWLWCACPYSEPLRQQEQPGILRTNLPPSTPLKPQQPGSEGGAWGKLPDALFGLFLKLSVHGEAPELAVPCWSGGSEAAGVLQPGAGRPCLVLHCPSKGKTPSLELALVLLELYLGHPSSPGGRGRGVVSPPAMLTRVSAAQGRAGAWVCL